MLQSTAEDGQGDPTRLVTGDVGLQLIHGPDIVEDILDNVGVRAVVRIVRHDLSFFFVSRERVTKIYSNAREEKYPIISYVSQFIGLWSINIGS
jgi:hypothetical protein